MKRRRDVASATGEGTRVFPSPRRRDAAASGTSGPAVRWNSCFCRRRPLRTHVVLGRPRGPLGESTARRSRSVGGGALGARDQR